MKLYLDRNVESIPIFKQLITILQGIDSSDLRSKLHNISEIQSVRQLHDPVVDFIDFYVQNSKLQDQFPQGRIQYIVNALYAAKGAPKVFEIFYECLGIKISYIYNFPELEVVQFNNVKASDALLFLDKFNSMIYYLLYYTKLNLYIKNLMLNLQGEIVQYISATVFGYCLYAVDKNNVSFNLE